jgi:CelD/BcsL family acetyltransferase involved in cellulose biosynthesis
MGKVIAIDPVKDSRWDAFVQNHPFGWVCHLSGWKQVLEKSFPQMKGHYFVLLDDTNTRIKAGIPVFAVNSWLTGKRLVSIPFATFCDPLISNNDEMSILLGAAKDLAEKIGAAYIEVRTKASSEIIESNAQLGKIEKFKQHSLFLNGDPESLMKSFHNTSVRQKVRKASRTNLKVRITNEARDIETFYKLYSNTRKFNGLPALPFFFIQSIFREFLPEKRVVLLMAELEAKLIAAMVLYKYKDRVSAEFLGWDRRSIKFQPSVFIYWEAIKMAQEEGYRVFDFGRTDGRNQSLMDFKGHWGTEVTGLPNYYYQINGSKLTEKIDKSFANSLARKVFRSVPNIFYLPLGNFCYRHMS